MKPMMLWIGLILLGLSAAGSAVPALAIDEARKAYDKMVEEATREADEYVQEKQKEQQAAAADTRVQKDDAFEGRVQAESQRIRKEMEIVQGRGLSSTFTQGMKDNLLKELQGKLNLLVSDPEAYFGAQ